MGKLKYITAGGLVIVLLIGTSLVSTESTGEVRDPMVAVDSYGNVHIIWMDASNYQGPGTGLYDLAYKSIRNGTWTSTEFLTFSSDHQGIWAYTLAVDKDDVLHVVWSQNSWDGETSYEYLYHIQNSGGEWNTPEILNYSYMKEERHFHQGVRALAVDDDGGVHAIISLESINDTTRWNQYENIYLRNLDGSWETVGEVPTSSEMHYSNMVVDANGIMHVAYVNNTRSDQNIHYLNYSGDVWSDPFNVSTEVSTNSFWPSLAVTQSGDIHITWETTSEHINPELNIDIMYRAKIGGVWIDTEMVSTESHFYSTASRMVVDEQGTVHCIWRDSTVFGGTTFATDTNIFYKSRTDGEWTTTELVSKGSKEAAYNPAITVDSYGNAHAVWCSSYFLTGYGIFYNCKPHQGAWE